MDILIRVADQLQVHGPARVVPSPSSLRSAILYTHTKGKEFLECSQPTGLHEQQRMNVSEWKLTTRLIDVSYAVRM
jgi:hypothetical protein